MTYVCGLVPVRSLGQGKTRLAPRLSDADRLALSTELLAGTLAALGEARTIGACWVISGDVSVGGLATRYKAAVLPELGADLNDTLAQALARVPLQTTHALILPLDLPWLTADGVDALVTYGLDGDADVVITPDRWESGTNALLLRRPFRLRPAFGPDSLAQHTHQAAALGLRLLVYRDPTLAFDLDTPADWAEYEQAPTRRRMA